MSDALDVDLTTAVARFTTRAGGVSAGPYASLNLGPFTDDDPAAVAENRRRVAAAAGARIAGTRQVHGARVVVARGPEDLAREAVARGVEDLARGAAERAADGLAGDDLVAVEEADGTVTAAHGVAPLVLTADCLPVVVAGERGVAALHAGWRGLAGGVLEEGVRQLRALGDAGALRAAIGPGAGACCYEVGEEVAGRFGARFRHGRHLDLKAAATDVLRGLGVREVHDVGACTMCDDRFFSHRRDGGVTGRQAGLAWRS